MKPQDHAEAIVNALHHYVDAEATDRMPSDIAAFRTTLVDAVREALRETFEQAVRYPTPEALDEADRALAQEDFKDIEDVLRLLVRERAKRRTVESDLARSRAEVNRLREEVLKGASDPANPYQDAASTGTSGAFEIGKPMAGVRDQVTVYSPAPTAVQGPTYREYAQENDDDARQAQNWRMVSDEVHRLDHRKGARMADDDVLPLVLNALRCMHKKAQPPTFGPNAALHEPAALHERAAIVAMLRRWCNGPSGAAYHNAAHAIECCIHHERP